MLLLFMVLTISLLIFLLIFLTVMISKKTKNCKEKWNPFECGFNMFNLARLPFSMNFFLIAIVFIIFDVEISMIFPMISTIFYSNIFKWTLSINLILFLIFLGTVIEWKENSLNWKK